MDQEQALKEAIRAAGGLGPVSEAIGVTRQAVWKWRRAPAERTLELERISGISRHDLRPDLYPREDASNVAQEA